MLWNVLLVSLTLAIIVGLFAPPQPWHEAYILCRQALCLSGALLVVALLLLIVDNLETAIVAGAACEIFFMLSVWLNACEVAYRDCGRHPRFTRNKATSRQRKPRVDWEAFNQARAQWSEEYLS